MADTVERTRFEPPESEAAAPFWAATREQRFVLPWCTDCDAPMWYPRDVCVHCQGSSIEWRPASGDGTIYAVSVQHRPGNPLMVERVPYAVALVDLAEGPRMLSTVVGVDPDEIEVGQAVEVTWEPLSDGRHLPFFRPAG